MREREREREKKEPLDATTGGPLTALGLQSLRHGASWPDRCVSVLFLFLLLFNAVHSRGGPCQVGGRDKGGCGACSVFV